MHKLTKTLLTPGHVLMTTDAIGGVWSFARELCAELQKHQIRVTLACLGPAPSTERRREIRQRGLDNVDLFENHNRLEWMDGSDDDVRRSGDWLLKLSETRAPDLVHLNGYMHASLNWSAPTVVVACMYPFR